ncbi:MAG: hypothetical protein ALECFALPRED_007415 [Alectoria fallacina]|uniref:Uncharacterized protein n=1 Tax=Alectoria fallacina TaxID=1903189 RepID=A0A8H3EWM1_9LECA|nr:MAG: hypothetical protein ALECFALPRED_007415 [Alectoria fallacina]
MASYSSENTEPERWAKIVEGAESGRHPEIMVDEGKLVAVSMPCLKGARIQSFLADVFKDGDNEWFRPASDSVGSSKGKAAGDGQPESSKKKKVSTSQQRANSREKRKDMGLVKSRAERSKDQYSPTEWRTITGKASEKTTKGVFLEGGQLVATGSSTVDASNKLDMFVEFALGNGTSEFGRLKMKGAARFIRHS